ncbi:hypothetical protein AGLY_016069 [Aphis glycines]|uniref:Uncharacterized protein n=1 Tax=Aphis glycines TaxID=307491 RepID=A0A6G0T0T7_APHGL|nr:hypothetical protein AGLY_016069 [Aphis glycines]
MYESKCVYGLNAIYIKYNTRMSNPLMESKYTIILLALGLSHLTLSGKKFRFPVIVFNKENTLLQEKSVLDHSHESDSTIERQIVSNSIKRKISESNINEMPSKIIRKELRSLENDSQLLTNDISYIRRNFFVLHGFQNDALQNIQVDTHIKIRSVEEGFTYRLLEKVSQVQKEKPFVTGFELMTLRIGTTIALIHSATPFLRKHSFGFPSSGTMLLHVSCTLTCFSLFTYNKRLGLTGRGRNNMFCGPNATSPGPPFFRKIVLPPKIKSESNQRPNYQSTRSTYSTFSLVKSIVMPLICIYYYYYDTERFVQLSRMNNSGGIQLTVALQMLSTVGDDGDIRRRRHNRGVLVSARLSKIR